MDYYYIATHRLPRSKYAEYEKSSEKSSEKSDEESKKEGDPCRAFDGKPSECEAATDVSCVVYPYYGKDYCIDAAGAKEKGTSTTKGKSTSAEKPAANEKNEATKEDAGKSDPESAPAESYFSREYNPGQDDFEVVDTLQVPTAFAVDETQVSLLS